MIDWRRMFCWMPDGRGWFIRDWEQEEAIASGSLGKRFIGGEWP